MPDQSLTITDNRTGKTYTVPVADGCIRAMDLRQIKTEPGDFGLMSYDPAFMNTAFCRSSITYIDGDEAILRYRGYPIEELAENCTFLEVAWLLLWGELPTAGQLEEWVAEITRHTMIHRSTQKVMDGFRYDAHPMAMLASATASLGALYPDARQVLDPDIRRRQIVRLIAKMPTLAAYSYRHRAGFPPVPPDNDLSYTGNFMSMLWRMTEPRYEPNPALERALDILFVLHADHEQNCSTSAMRVVGSSQADPYAAAAAAIGALSGPLHGGANEQVLRMLDEIGTLDNVKRYIERVKTGDVKLMGFGHRIYKNYDPRARIIKWTAEQVFKVTGRNRKLDIALELERIALEDDYFVQRKLYPNVDFYSGIIFRALGLPPAMFTPVFAVARTVGWVAHWNEMMTDPETRIVRPRQLYTGPTERGFVPVAARSEHPPLVG